MNTRPRVALGMSGGVDSSLSAVLLQEQGYDVTGVFLECWRAPGCRSEEDRQDALEVALKLNIPFQVLDFKNEYKQSVVEYFFEEYEAGRTPNPDVVCNREIKFGMFYRWAMEHTFEYVATGHYAAIGNEGNNLHLMTPKDAWKDQTYFLYQLEQHQLSHILFPLGELTKQEVREQAQVRELAVANKKDSVGICFIGDINVHNFLKERLGENSGEVVDIHGNVIGNHQGLWFYTIGQRHGFEVRSTTSIKRSDGTSLQKTNLPPFYVIGKNAQKNQLIVGFGAEAYVDSFVIRDLHTIDPQMSVTAHQKPLLTRIRHTGELVSCSILQNERDTFTVRLEKPLKGVAEGQSAVFYSSSQEKERYFCLGGGIISAPATTQKVSD